MKVVCNVCGAEIEYHFDSLGRLVLDVFATEMKEKCPNVIARGEQTGSASYWDCQDLRDQILNP